MRWVLSEICNWSCAGSFPASRVRCYIRIRNEYSRRACFAFPLCVTILVLVLPDGTRFAANCKDVVNQIFSRAARGSTKAPFVRTVLVLECTVLVLECAQRALKRTWGVHIVRGVRVGPQPPPRNFGRSVRAAAECVCLLCTSSIVAP